MEDIEMINNHKIGGLRIAMQALADSRGIVLKIGGEGVHTNGKVITIPSLPEDDALAMILARGYIDHEAAHVALTDFNIPNDSMWNNLLEDVRIEKQQGEKYPGVAVNTASLLEAVVKQGGFALSDHQVANLMIWAASRTRTRILRQKALAETEVIAEKRLRSELGDSFCDEFVKIVDTVKDCKSTGDCHDVAERIQNLIMTPPPPPPPPPKHKSNSQDGDGDEDGKSSKSKSKSKSKPKPGEDEGDGEDKDDKPSKSKAKSKPDGDDGKDGDGDGDSKGESEGKDGDGNSSKSKSKPSEGNGDGDGSSEGNDGDGDLGDPPSDTNGGDESGAGAGGKGTGGSRELNLRQINNLRSMAASPVPDKDVANLSEMLEKALEQMVAISETVAAVPKTTKIPTRIYNVGKFELFKAELAEASLKNAKMKTQLSGLFQAISMKQKYPSMIGSRISPRSLHLVGCQDPG